jgi:hypothetical protein
VKISGGTIYAGEKAIPHYGLSYEKQCMTTDSAKILAELIIRLKHPLSSRELMKGNHGTFHVLVRDEKQSGYA